MNRAHPLGALVLAAALLVAGCGAPAATTTTSTTTSSTTTAATSTTSTTTSTTTSSAPASGTVDKDALLKQLTAGNATVKTMTTTMDIAIKSADKTATTAMVMAVDQSDPKHLRASMTMNIGVGDMAVVMDGDNYYLQMAGTWYKMTKEQLQKTGGTAPDTSTQADTLNKLGGKIQKVELIGTEQVEGVATKHYRLTLDGSAFGDLGTGATAAPTTDTIPYDLWVDDGGVMRKYSIALQETDSSITMTGVVSKINQPLAITIPKDAKTFPGS